MAQTLVEKAGEHITRSVREASRVTAAITGLAVGTLAGLSMRRK